MDQIKALKRQNDFALRAPKIITNPNEKYLAYFRQWQGNLLLDERAGVSYPDGAQAANGRIYVIYDRDRYGAKEILMAVFTEEDVLAQTTTNSCMRLKVLINKAEV